MAPASIHQVIHGYHDGHRLLSSSTPLSTDATRALLVLSDMSGPSMQLGFDEYLTGYPLPGSEFFVLAKTWYAPEMQRPGCVWTHSLLIPQELVSRVTTAGLLKKFRRPQLESVEKAAATPFVLDDVVGGSSAERVGDRAIAATLVGAVLGQARPVMVAVDSAAQLQTPILQLWECLWPAEKARFSFCTGALMPRANAGALLDLQALPRAIPPSQFRKSASAALVLDLRVQPKLEPWVDLVLDGMWRGAPTFRTWLEAVAGVDADRSVVPSLAPIFGEWHMPDASARSVLTSVVNAKDLDASVRSRLIGMVFDRADTESGATCRRKILQDLCRHRDADLASIAPMLEDQTRHLFATSRAEGSALIRALVGSELTDVGEHVLRAAVLLLAPNDLETFDEAHAPFLPTIVGANPQLASSSILWKWVGSRSAEVLSQLGGINLNDEERGEVVEAIIASGSDVSTDAIIRFGGKVAVFRCLNALSSGELRLSWQWRSALSAQSGDVLEWLESISSPSLRDLELGSRLVSPKVCQSRLATVWKRGTVGALAVEPRVAAFGLTLAFGEGCVKSPLLALCFQPTFGAAESSRLEHEEWDWLREQAPSVYWWRDWDKCERLAAALARLVERQNASLETVFAIVQSQQAIRKIAVVLYDNKNTRPYLKSLRKTAESLSVGTREQREALLDN